MSLLYEAEMKQVDPQQVLRSLEVAPQDFVVELVSGVGAQLEHIDELIGAASVGWEIERMPVVDRCLLRMACWELVARRNTPVAVIIDEAVELAKQYSTDQSGAFVNGVLSTVAQRVRFA